MIKGLYNNFAHWYHGGQIYFYSDPHFADEDCKFFRKEDISDEEQVKAINKKIGKNDTIIFLGDIGDEQYIKSIRGYKVLIMGNHDKGATNYTELFDEVYEGALCISDKIILSHEPIFLSFMYNIHGHCHSAPLHIDDKHLNCCAEVINYTPICFGQLIKSGIFKEIKTIHRMTIDKIAEEKNNEQK